MLQSVRNTNTDYLVQKCKQLIENHLKLKIVEAKKIITKIIYKRVEWTLTQVA
jgi:hypothetical protein